LKEGDGAARVAGLEPQQYLMLLAIRGLATEVPPKNSDVRGTAVAETYSAVELVDRLEQRGLVRRTRSKEDRRQVLGFPVTTRRKAARDGGAATNQRIASQRPGTSEGHRRIASRQMNSKQQRASAKRCARRREQIAGKKISRATRNISKQRPPAKLREL